jgi:hypothetical protein
MTANLINIQVSSSPSSYVFQPCDWAIVNLPADPKDAEKMFSNLYNTPVSNQSVLVLCRHKRKMRPEALSNMNKIKGFTYLDTVSITYEKPSSCSNNGLLPLAETGFLFYKGDIPDTKKTSWFSGDRHTNATNFWDVAPQDDESAPSYYQKFNWDTNLILKSMMGTLSTRRFYYGFPVTADEISSIYSFCKKYMVVCHLFVDSAEEAEKVNKIIKEIK